MQSKNSAQPALDHKVVEISVKVSEIGKMTFTLETKKDVTKLAKKAVDSGIKLLSKALDDAIKEG